VVAMHPPRASIAATATALKRVMTPLSYGGPMPSQPGIRNMECGIRNGIRNME
jgi:hypothetical protein